ncbi:hypothetical protein B0H14DRAFT_3435317 [Mycena olivaceomarginata]|nr:hypothetical protein B0H14DRAFT_3435317 [Mycena olivaceomarginata]
MIKVGKTEKLKISDELAELGFYARFTESASDLTLLHPLIPHTAISAPFMSSSTSPSPPAPRSPPPRSLASYPTCSLTCAASFPAARAYAPATSTRWRAGGHIPALNWQRYDAGTQLNEGLFVGSPGWVLKPARLRGGSRTLMGSGFRGSGYSGYEKEKRADWHPPDAVPPPNGRAAKAYSTYVYAELLHFEQDRTWLTKVTQDVPGAGANVLWNERFEWEFAADDLAFLRLTVMQSEFGRDDKIVGLHFVRIFDMNGKNSGATLLVRFSVGPAE